MTPLRILVLPADAGACGHTRLAWPAECAGRDPELRVEVRPEGFQVTKDHQGRIVDVHVSMADGRPPDVLVTQRPLHRDWTFAIPALQRRGVRVVVDVDDDFRTVHRANKAWGQVQPHLNADHNWEWLERACDAADLVTVTTPALAGRYGAHGRVRVLPNYVPAALLAEQRPAHDGVIVGWPGTMAVHPADLQTTRGAVGRALRRTGATFRVIGDGRGVQQALGLGHKPDVTGMLPLASYLRALPALDVVIVPLEDTPFTASKSCLKAMEASGAGCAVVMAPTPDNVRLHQAGIGVLARTPKEWEAELVRLIQNRDARLAQQEANRAVMGGFTIEGHAHEWAEAWRSVVPAHRPALQPVG